MGFHLGPCLEHRVGILAAQRAMGQGALAGANCTALEAERTGYLCLCLFNKLKIRTLDRLGTGIRM